MFLGLLCSHVIITQMAIVLLRYFAYVIQVIVLRLIVVLRTFAYVILAIVLCNPFVPQYSLYFLDIRVMSTLA
jgi:hypothetical protein